MGNEYNEFLEDTANSICTCASEFNNRAVALMELGRYIEAQRDFDTACRLEPDPSYLLNAAELFLILGMKEHALENVRKARQVAGSGDVTDPRRLYYVAHMFLKCGEPEPADEALVDFLQFLLSIIPFTVKDNTYGHIIRKDGHTIQTAPSIMDLDHLNRLVGAINEAKGRKSTTRQIKELLQKVKAGMLSIKKPMKNSKTASH